MHGTGWDVWTVSNQASRSTDIPVSSLLGNASPLVPVIVGRLSAKRRSSEGRGPVPYSSNRSAGLLRSRPSKSTIACTPRSAPPVEPVQTGRSRWVRKETRSSPLPSTRISLWQGFQRLRLLIPVQTGPVSKTLPPYSYLHGG